MSASVKPFLLSTLNSLLLLALFDSSTLLVVALVIQPTKTVRPFACLLLICRLARWLHTLGTPLSLKLGVLHASTFLRTSVLSRERLRIG